MAVNPNTNVQVIHLNTVTPAQVEVNYGPAFAVNVTDDHEHSEYVTHDDLDVWVDSVNDRIDSDTIKPDDPRLTDARTPTEHRHDYSDIDNTPTIPASPEDVGAQPAGDYAAGDHDHDGVYVKPDDLPDPPDLSRYVQDDDPRLSDERDPTEHQHNYSDIIDPPAIPATPEDIGAQTAGDYASAGHHHDGTYQPVGDYLTADDLPTPPDLTDVVREDDPRLSDARPPTAHSHPEYLTSDDLPEVPDLSEFVTDDDPRLSDAREPTAHSHSEYLTAGDLPAPPDLSDVVRDDDPRLSDARPPTEHDHDDRYVRTVNGTGPDENGDVAVEGGGSGILTGNGNPNTLGIEADTVGVLYADEAKTDGAALWSADSVNMYDGTTWKVVNGYATKRVTAGGVELTFNRYGSRLVINVIATLTESGNGEGVTLPASTIDLGEADGGFMGAPYACTLVLTTLPEGTLLPPVVELPPIVCVFTQMGRYVLHMPEIVIPAYTSSDPVMVMGSMELFAETPWPVGSGGGDA